MRVVIIGAGNVASVLGRLILLNGHQVVQVTGRTPDNAALLAGQLGCPYVTDWKLIDPDGDLYLVALSDTAINSFAAEVLLPDRLVVHTAGAVSGSVLLSTSRHSGVLYPLQSLRKENGLREGPPIPHIPLLVSANEPSDLDRVAAFAGTLSDIVVPVGDEARLKLHLAGVLVNNFTNHLYALAAEYCTREGVDFGLLLPLIRETAERSGKLHPAEAQTGPAARGDEATIEQHLTLLNKYRDIKELYRLFTIQIKGRNLS